MDKRCFAVLLLVLAAFAWPARAQAEPAEPPFPIADSYQLVNDHLGVLSIEQSVRLTTQLQALERRNGTQIVLLIVPWVGEQGPREYAMRVATHWDIGNNGQHNGVLVLVTQRQGLEVLTGDGIGGALPDVTVARTLRERLEPEFARGRFDVGVLAAMEALIAAAQGEDTAPTAIVYAPDIIYIAPSLSWLHQGYEASGWRFLAFHGLLLALVIYLATLAALWWRRRKKARA